MHLYGFSAANVTQGWPDVGGLGRLYDYYIGLMGDYIGIMENKMETTSCELVDLYVLNESALHNSELVQQSLESFSWKSWLGLLLEGMG